MEDGAIDAATYEESERTDDHDQQADGSYPAAESGAHHNSDQGEEGRMYENDQEGVTAASNGGAPSYDQDGGRTVRASQSPRRRSEDRRGSPRAEGGDPANRSRDGHNSERYDGGGAHSQQQQGHSGSGYSGSGGGRMREDAPRKEGWWTSGEGPRSKRGPLPGAEQTNLCMYIGNLSYRTTEPMLAEACARFGDVRHVKLVRDRETNDTKGYAFITFFDEAGCAKTCQGLNMTELDGRTVRVEPALGHKFNGDERGGYWPYGALATSATENVGPPTHGNPFKPAYTPAPRGGSRERYPPSNRRGTGGGFGASQPSNTRGSGGHAGGSQWGVSAWVDDDRRQQGPGYNRSDSRERDRYPNTTGGPVRRGDSRERGGGARFNSGPPVQQQQQQQYNDEYTRGRPDVSTRGMVGPGYEGGPQHAGGRPGYGRSRSPPYDSRRGGYPGAAPGMDRNPNAPSMPRGSSREKHIIIRSSSGHVERGAGGLVPVVTAHVAPPLNADNRTVFVGNLPSSIQVGRVKELFERCGRIESVRVHQEKGFGFVTFLEPQSASNALRFMDKMELEGRLLRVSTPTPVRPPEYNDTRMSGGRGPGRGGFSSRGGRGGGRGYHNNDSYNNMGGYNNGNGSGYMPDRNGPRRDERRTNPY